MQSWRTHCRSREHKLLVGSGGLDFKKGSKGMDSLDKHVEQISFRQCVALLEHGQPKGWQPHFQPTVAKSSISTTVHWFAAVTKHNWEHNHCIATNLGDHNSVTKISASLHKTGFFYLFLFSAAATKGWAWCNHNVMQSWRTYCRSRELKLLVGSGGLDFTKGSKGLNSLDKHVEQTSFRQWVTLTNIGSWKAGSPTANPQRLKAESRQFFIDLQQSHI